MIVKPIRLQGPVTVAIAGQLKQQIKDTLGNDACILAFDLSSVDYMDSAGLGALVFAFKRAKELGGSVRVHQPQKRVKDLMFMTNMDQVFQITDSPLMEDVPDA